MSDIIQTNEYITFTLGDEEYAIEVSKIESILEYTKITKLPGTDESVKGVIDLRGDALPVVDLRVLLNIEESEITENTSIIVMFINHDDKISTLGGMVDSVKEVLEITPEMIQDLPKVGTKINTDFISGIAKKGDNFIIILDISKVLTTELLALAEDENLLIAENITNGTVEEDKEE
jgi:purine-binding chemotaxis protein CheW